MVLYVENSKDSIIHTHTLTLILTTLELLNKFSKVEQFKISTQNQLHFYH